MPMPAPLPGHGRPPSRRAQQQSAARRARRRARYDEVCRLRDLGWSQRAIAEQVQMDRRTVRRWLRAGSFPEQQPRPCRGSQLDPYKAYVQKRWQQGCHNARQLGDELRAHGYRGGHTTVRDYVARLRLMGQQAASPPPVALPRPRMLRWLLWAPAQELQDGEYALVEQLCHHSREVMLAYGLVTDFQALVRERQGGQLASWVALAQASGVAELAGFARGIVRDWAAVQAGLELEWSSGPVEGQVNRLKMLKRQMYGRAKFDLLRQRVLYAH
jgi:transposase